MKQQEKDLENKMKENAKKAKDAENDLLVNVLIFISF